MAPLQTLLRFVFGLFALKIRVNFGTAPLAVSVEITACVIVKLTLVPTGLGTPADVVDDFELAVPFPAGPWFRQAVVAKAVATIDNEASALFKWFIKYFMGHFLG
jgi:hypothetical protein